MRTNPLRVLRLRYGLTQEALAHFAGVTRQVVTMAEQGLYNRAPVSLVLTLLRLDEFSVMGPHALQLAQDSLERQYGVWVADKRIENQHYFAKVSLSSYETKETKWQGLKFQVAGSSTSKFCQRLVYQKSLIREYELYGRGSNGIYRALQQCGLPSDQILELVTGSSNN